MVIDGELLSISNLAKVNLCQLIFDSEIYYREYSPLKQCKLFFCAKFYQKGS